MSDTPVPDWLSQAWTVLATGGAVQVANWLLAWRKARGEERSAEAKADADLENIVSERLKTLLEAYEKRIVDLSSEVHALRAEVVSLRKALDERPRLPQIIGM